MAAVISDKYNRLPVNISSLVQRIRSPENKIAYDTKKFWTEFQIVNRVIYRSHNQHKASFSFQHLKEVKRLVERIGKLELWLKANYTESGEGLFDFIGFLNTLLLLIEKTLKACRKTFYYYTHYLEQGLFVSLSLLVISSVSVLHNELLQWIKYIKLLYSSFMKKLNDQNESKKVSEWCRVNNLATQILIEEPSKVLPLSLNTTNLKQKDKFNNRPYLKPSSKKTKITNKDEIDDIFNSL